MAVESGQAGQVGQSGKPGKWGSPGKPLSTGKPVRPGNVLPDVRSGPLSRSGAAVCVSLSMTVVSG